MADDSLAEWAEYHASAFGLTTPEHRAAPAQWLALFEREGFAAVELREATDWLLSRAGKLPAGRLGHLAAIIARVRERRRVAAAGSPDDGPAPSGCATCRPHGGDGMLSLPHRRYVVRGRWQSQGRTYYTEIVLCQCPAALRGHPVGVPLLTDYEMSVPHWRTLLFDRRESERAERKAMAEAEAADAKRGPLGAVNHRGKQA